MAITTFLTTLRVMCHLHEWAMHRRLGLYNNRVLSHSCLWIEYSCAGTCSPAPVGCQTSTTTSSLNGTCFWQVRFISIACCGMLCKLENEHEQRADVRHGGTASRCPPQRRSCSEFRCMFPGSGQADHSYTVEVFTSDLPGAGSDATVRCILYGETGEER
jgi:hypothetical protein